MGVIEFQESIDLGKEGLNPAGIQELATVVRGDGKDLFHLSAANQAAQGAQDFSLVDSPYVGDEIVTGFAFDEDKQAAFAMDAGDNGIHLPTAKLASALRPGRRSDVANHLDRIGTRA